MKGNGTMMLNWEEYLQQIVTTTGEIGRASPEIMRNHVARQFSGAGAEQPPAAAFG
jgi:hypothetical protein